MLDLLDRIADGRTDLVFEYVAAGNVATATAHEVSLIRWCAYYGDVSAIKFLLGKGETLAALGVNYDLNGVCFHGHWRLCQFLIEQGADVNRAEAATGETPLHAVLCKTNRVRYLPLLRILLAAGADPNLPTLNAVETGSFMRDCRTKGETPLHRAAAFGNEEDIRLLLEAGAHIDAKDANGDTLSVELAGTFVPAQSYICFVMGISTYIRNAKDKPAANRQTAPWKAR